MIQRLTEIALDFNSGMGDDQLANVEPIVPMNIITQVPQNSNSTVQEFNAGNFFKFISHEISKKNIGKMLYDMSKSMCSTFEKNKVHGSISSLQKVQSLKGRWFKVNTENVEQIIAGNLVERNCLYLKDGMYYRVISIFKKTYNKWRYERIGKTNEKMKVHLQALEKYHCSYHADEFYRYKCVDSSELGVYIGHTFNICK